MKKVFLTALALTACALLFAACAPAPAAAPAVEATPEPAATATPTASPEPTPEPVTVTLYVPAPDEKTVLPKVTSIPENSGRALLAALVEAGTLPDVDFGRNLYIEAGDGTAKIRGEKTAGRLVRADFSKAFGDAIRNMPSSRREEAVMQCLVNTLVTFYEADAMTLTIEATTLETKSRTNYEHGMMMDMFVPREDTEQHSQSLTLRATVTDAQTGEVTTAEEVYEVSKGKRCSVSAAKSGLSCTVQALGGSAVMVETKKEMNLIINDAPVGAWKQFFVREGVPVTIGELKEKPDKKVRFELLLSPAASEAGEDPA